MKWNQLIVDIFQTKCASISNIRIEYDKRRINHIAFNSTCSAADLEGILGIHFSKRTINCACEVLENKQSKKNESLRTNLDSLSSYTGRFEHITCSDPRTPIFFNYERSSTLTVRMDGLNLSFSFCASKFCIAVGSARITFRALTACIILSLIM